MKEKINLFTIGFTQTSAENFFSRLKNSGVTRLIDVRLNNRSQLAAFAKSEDLAFFLKYLCNSSYTHNLMLAPTDRMLSEYKSKKTDWGIYQGLFIKLLEERKIEEKINPESLVNTCLLCSESTPHFCHRRLVGEYLNKKWGNILNITHL